MRLGLLFYWEVSLMNLTTKQEKFVRGLVSGLSQRKAYRAAYPSSEKWKDEAVDSKACNLLKVAKVKARYDELREKAENAAIMTRAQRMITLSDIAQFSKKDDSRIKAIDTLNKMDGIYTNKIELAKPVDETVKEMTEYLNGRIKNDDQAKTNT